MARVNTVFNGGYAFFELRLRLPELREGVGEVFELVVELLFDRREVVHAEGGEID